MAQGHAGDEQHYNGWSSAPGNTSNQPSPNFREHAIQPPLLTTSLSGIQFQHGHGTTPLSSTSLSSPFIHGQSPPGTSPAIGRSPLRTRQPTNYNVPYNPQDWGPPAGGAAAQAQYAHSGSQRRVIPQQRAQTGEYLAEAEVEPESSVNNLQMNPSHHRLLHTHHRAIPIRCPKEPSHLPIQM